MEGLTCTTLPIGKVRKMETGSCQKSSDWGAINRSLESFDTLPDEVLIAEVSIEVLIPREFDLKAFKLINNYLPRRIKEQKLVNLPDHGSKLSLD